MDFDHKQLKDYGGIMDFLTKTKEKDELLFDSLHSEYIRKSQSKEMPALKIIDKKSKIKKLRKNQKKICKEESPQKIQQQATESELLDVVMDDLYDKIQLLARNKNLSGSLACLGPEQALAVLQKIEGCYSQFREKVNSLLLPKNIKQWNTTNSILLTKFVGTLTRYLPDLKELMILCKNRFSGIPSFKKKYTHLLQMSITPILSVMMDELTEADAFTFPEECETYSLEELPWEEQRFEEADRQSEEEPQCTNAQKKKKKKRKAKKDKNKETEREDEEDAERSKMANELIEFLAGMEIKQENRVPCRVEEKYLQRWRSKLHSSTSVE